MPELTKMFELSPSHQVTITAESFPFVPIQIMETLLQPILNLEPYDSNSIQSITPMDTSNRGCIKTVMGGNKGGIGCPLSMPMKDSHRTLIPGTRRYMSHDWCDNTPTTATVSKADGALVATHMWDARITAVFPSFTTSVLSKFRRYVLTHKFQMLYKEFITFMSNEHRTSWNKLMLDEGYSKVYNFGEGGSGRVRQISHSWKESVT